MSTNTATLPHQKFTVDEYHNFIKQGMFQPEERVELWAGELIEPSPVGKRHAGTVSALSDVLKDINRF